VSYSIKAWSVYFTLNILIGSGIEEMISGTSGMNMMLIEELCEVWRNREKRK
jgi:hypothetical protein